MYAKEHAADRRRWARDGRRHAPERYRKYYTAWAAANPELVRVNGGRRAARKRGAMLDTTFTARDWQRLVQRYRGCCAYCGAPSDSLTVDHVVPLTKGGKHSVGNILPACLYCNCTKQSLFLSVWRFRNGGGGPAPAGWTAASAVVRGERNGNTPFTADQVREIRRLYSDGVTQVALGKAYSVSNVAISNIVRRKTWKHID